MKYLIVIIVLSFNFILEASAQNRIDSTLRLIEENNITLRAARKNADAEKTGNQTGIYLPNPEVEFAYLWGSPSLTGNRTDFSIKQSIDFPTAYGHRSSISNLKNEQADLDYESQRRLVLLQARLTCIELIYRNALYSELSRRLNHARSISDAYNKMLVAGEANILERNRARINLATLSGEYELNEAERNSLLNQLVSLNGGKAVAFNDSIFPTVIFNNDFNEWYTSVESKYTALEWMNKETEIRIRQEKLNVAMSLPRLNAGYMSENIPGQEFRGITAGITIPLWENRNTVKYAKARTAALENLIFDEKIQIRNRMKSLHDKTIALQEAINVFKVEMNEYNNEVLLKKAFDSGQISLSEYFVELSGYYNAIDKLLEMERNFQITHAELTQLK